MKKAQPVVVNVEAAENETIKKGEKDTKNPVTHGVAAAFDDPVVRSMTPVGDPSADGSDAKYDSALPPFQPKTLIRVKTPEAREARDFAATECPFNEFGCKASGAAHDIRKHIRDQSVLHLSQMCDAVSEMRRASTVAAEANVNASRKANDTAQRVNQIEKLFSAQFVWRITDYASAYSDARRCRPAIIHSPTFLSHRHGYKLALAAALYGDSDAISEFNSIFVTILRGEHDGILPWPFSCPVTFTMLSQKTDEKDVTRTLTPRVTETNLPFLGRPQSDRNPAFGIKTFVDLRLMNEGGNFVVDDCCFIRIDIDLSSIYCYI